MNELTIGSLFSGIGGIELGFEMAGGFKTLWFVEKDSYAQAILRKYWPSATIYDDVTQLDFGSVPKVDILTGGFPCQDISNAGRRVGITGSRSSLWKYYLEAISQLRPRYAFIENVSALLNRGLGTVLTDLAEVGYDAEWHCISASSVGAPHRRDRIFILAYPNEHGNRAERGTDSQEAGEVLGNSQSNVLNSSSKALSYSYGKGQSRTGKTQVGLTEHPNTDFTHSDSSGEQLQANAQRRESHAVGSDNRGWGSKEHNCICSWWAAEPELGRVAHGIPNRVDRIKCLGNAVVPQCAEVFAREIKEQEAEARRI